MTVNKEELPSDNVLNMRRERDARKPLGLSCWTARRGGITRAEIERVEQLSAENVMYNTTFKVRSDLTPPMLESKSLSLGVTPQYYPAGIFLETGEDCHSAGRRLQDGIHLLYDLQTLAIENDLKDWRELPESKLPGHWMKQKVGGGAGRGNASRAGSVVSTPKTTRRTRMNWNAPRPALPTTPKARTDVLTAPGHAYSSPAFNPSFETPPVDRMAIHYELGDSPASIDSCQSRSWLDFSPYQGSAFTEINQHHQNVDTNMLLNDSLQGQAHLALAAATGQLGFGTNYFANDGDPFVDGYPFALDNDYNTQFNNMANQMFQQRQGEVTSLQTNTQGFQAHRFNGYGEFSVRQNPVHQLNLNTTEVLTRSNPFMFFGGEQLPMSPKRSFEDFMAHDLPF